MKIKKNTPIGMQDVVDISVSMKTYISNDTINHNCKHCWSLWTMPDKVLPRIYKMSELSGSPGDDYKNPSPSISPTHISCRDVLTVLMPGFGFSKDGNVEYIGNNHDEWTKQRSSKT